MGVPLQPRLNVRPTVGVVRTGHERRRCSWGTPSSGSSSDQGARSFFISGEAGPGQDDAGGRGGPRRPCRRRLRAVRPLRGGLDRPLPALRRGPRSLRQPRRRGRAPGHVGRPWFRTGPAGPDPGEPDHRSAPAEGHRQRHRAVPALRRRGRPAGHVSDSDPVVLVLDDLQWADTGSLLLLRHLATADLPMRVLILGTYRDSELSRPHPLRDTLGALRRQHGVSRHRAERPGRHRA